MNEYEQLQNSDVYEIVNTPTGDKVNAYGVQWPLASPFAIELTAYRHNLGGNALWHMTNAHNIAWPEDALTWNDWTDRRFGAHCEGHKIITMAGGANCGKSYDAAKIGLLFWLANPGGRTVLVASTSLTDLDSRIWGYVKRFHDQAAIELSGTLLTSPPPKILLTKKDTVHGMFAVPLQRGTPSKTTSTLIGRHPDEGFLAIIDEGTDVTPGFMGAVPNWEKSPFFQMIVIGNSASAFDPHGILSRPEAGWDSVDPDYDREWPIKNGVCLYFDCYQSPALFEPDPIKKKALERFLFTERSIETAKQDYGDNSPEFWRFTRGFWPKDDVSQTVLTATMVDRFKVKGKVQWSGTEKIHRVAGLDPAFTPEGDECILRFAKFGHAVGGKWILDFGGEDAIHRLSINAESDEPAEYQIVHQTMRLCLEYGVEPQNLAIDVWGPGSGLGAIFETVWSPYIYKVSSAGRPTDTWVDAEKTQTARDAYDRRVTELWFSMQKFVQAAQIKGLDDVSCEQFCTREFAWSGKKYALETKEEYKLRLGKVDRRYVSPDRADAASLILDLVRQYFHFVPSGIIESGTAEPTLLQQYLHGRGLSEPAGEHNGDIRSAHPNSWGDGFLVGDTEEM
jgi:hypothetical protein